MNFRGGKRTKKKRSKSYKNAGNKKIKSRANSITHSMRRKLSLAKNISIAKIIKNYSRKSRNTRRR
jgi:hypothetical protein